MPGAAPSNGDHSKAQALADGLHFRRISLSPDGKRIQVASVKRNNPLFGSGRDVSGYNIAVNSVGNVPDHGQRAVGSGSVNSATAHVVAEGAGGEEGYGPRDTLPVCSGSVGGKGPSPLSLQRPRPLPRPRPRPRSRNSDCGAATEYGGIGDVGSPALQPTGAGAGDESAGTRAPQSYAARMPSAGECDYREVIGMLQTVGKPPKDSRKAATGSVTPGLSGNERRRSSTSLAERRRSSTLSRIGMPSTLVVPASLVFDAEPLAGSLSPAQAPLSAMSFGAEPPAASTPRAVAALRSAAPPAQRQARPGSSLTVPTPTEMPTSPSFSTVV